ncbi:uncharacterized protein LOC121050445 [Rosa chinensis]|uniref:uncharacterized protein LOC121050445 n=1 Tax=Rosa chinensis TaxID=74649 RepID=UPI001AD92AAF|nr:uncharacterized protein LOC121050445 [Rosa chinensis]
MDEIQPPEIKDGQFIMGLSETVGAKWQRRPSVRLGEIRGDQPYDSNSMWATKQWRLPAMDHHQPQPRSSQTPESQIPSTQRNPIDPELRGVANLEPLDARDDADRFPANSVGKVGPVLKVSFSSQERRWRWDSST